MNFFIRSRFFTVPNAWLLDCQKLIFVNFHSYLFFKRETTYKTLLVKVPDNMPATASVIGDVAAHNVPNVPAVPVASAVTYVGAIVGVPWDPAYVMT